MTFRGMAATDDGGSFAGMFTTRDYGYDPSFEWLPPPWFPVVEDAYTVLFFRELPSVDVGAQTPIPGRLMGSDLRCR